MPNVDIKMPKLFKSISFDRIRQIVERLIDNEYQYGIYESPPDVFIDFATADAYDTGEACITFCSGPGQKYQKVPYSDCASYIDRLAAQGPVKAGILLPNNSPFGTLSITRMVSVHSDKTYDDELPAVFSKNLNIDLNNTTSDLGFLICGSTPGKDIVKYMVSVIPEESRESLERSPLVEGAFGDKITAVRVIDRTIPLSNYILTHLGDKAQSFNMILCIEQRGDNLFIWNLYRIENGLFIPVGSETKKVPAVETHDSLVNVLNLLEHELVRIKSFISPDCVVVITDEGPMVNGMFAVDDLVSVCSEVVDGSDAVYILKDENAAITGALEMEEVIASNRDKILERIK